VKKEVLLALLESLISDHVEKIKNEIEPIKGERGLRGKPGRSFDFEESKEQIDEILKNYVEDIRSSVEAMASDVVATELDSLPDEEEVKKIFTAILQDNFDTLKLKFSDLSQEEIESLKGDRGPRGQRGRPGIDGHDGKDGIDGKDGERGEKGEKGDEGLRGPRGLRGQRGKSGKSFDFEENRDSISEILNSFFELSRDTLRLKFSDLTELEKDELKLKFSDLTEEEIEELRGPKGARGQKGKCGAKGEDGSVWYYGNGKPEIGARDGDFYLDIERSEVYHFKDRWSVLCNIRGRDGLRGVPGLTGVAGRNGMDGADGTDGIDAPTIERVEVKLIKNKLRFTFIMSNGERTVSNGVKIPTSNIAYFQSSSGTFSGELAAEKVVLDTTNFDGLLSSSDSNLQTAMETLDEVDLQAVYDNSTPKQIDVTAGDINILNGGIVQDYTIYNSITAPTHTEGLLYYSDDDKTLSFQTEVNGVTVNIGEELHIRGVNKSASASDFSNGQLVYISGAQGQRPKVELASASQDNSDKTIGMVTQDTLAYNNTGYISTYGVVRELDTSAYSEGTILYLSTTPGAFTDTVPVSPNHRVVVGIVIYQHATKGMVQLTIDTGFHLENAHDVLISSEANNDVLQWNNTSGVWENRSSLTIQKAATFNNESGDNDFIIKSQTGNAYQYDAGIPKHIFTGDFVFDHIKYLDADTGETTSLFIGENAGNVGSGNLNNVHIGRDSGANSTSSNIVAIGKNSAENLLASSNGFALGTSAALNGNTLGSFIGIGSNVLSGAQNSNNLIAIGQDVLKVANGASASIGIGDSVLDAMVSGESNVAVGYQALSSETSVSGCTVVGTRAAMNSVGEGFVTFVGYECGENNSDPSVTGIGYQCLESNSGNTAVAAGYQAGQTNAGNSCSLLGYRAGRNNIAANLCAIGTNCFRSNQGSSNVGLGVNVGLSNTTGATNTFIGTESGRTNVSGSGNVFLGFNAGYSETNSNKLYVANSSTVTPLIYGEFDNTFLRVYGTLKSTAKQENIATTSTTETIDVETATFIRQTASGITTSLSNVVTGSRMKITNRSGGDNTLNITVQGEVSPTIYDGETFDLIYNGTDWDLG